MTVLSHAVPLDANRNRPDPNNGVTQGIYFLDFVARFLGNLGKDNIGKLIAAVATADWVTALGILAGANDPDLKRLGGILEAYQNERPTEAHPLGYYCTILIANTSSGTKDANGKLWDTDPQPFGNPDP